MTIGERIKERRIELGLSQEDLAKKCGYKSRSSINKIEIARDLPLNKVEKMAYALGVQPSYLMGWEEDLEKKADIASNMYLGNDKFMDVYLQLDDSNKEELYLYAKFLLHKQREA